jgi:hypothetical protein
MLFSGTKTSRIRLFFGCYALSSNRNFENKTFLWLLRFIIEQTAELGKEKNVTICGEGASHPEFVPLQLSLGFRSLSITPTSAQSVACTDPCVYCKFRSSCIIWELCKKSEKRYRLEKAAMGEKKE